MGVVKSVVQGVQGTARSALEATKKERATEGTLTRKVQDALYTSHPDFGSYDKEAKAKAVVEVLQSFNPSFGAYPPELQQQSAQELLGSMGEAGSYGYGTELIPDVAGPAIGGALGARGGKLGIVGGAGAGALATEVAKKDVERYRRGIPTRSGEVVNQVRQGNYEEALQGAYDIMSENASPAVMETISQIALNPMAAWLVDKTVGKVGRSVARRIFKPETELPAPIAAAQRQLGAIGESLTAGQLNAHEKNLVYLAEGVGGGGAIGGKRIWNKYRSNYKLLETEYEKLMGQISEQMEPSEWGRMLAAAKAGELNLVKVFRDEYHSAARRGLTRLVEKNNLQVDIGSLIDWAAEEAGKKGRTDVLSVLTGINDFLGLKSLAEFKPGTDIAQLTYLVAPELQGAPRTVTALQAADLLRRLNGMYDSESIRGASTHAADIVRDKLVSTVRAVDPNVADAFEQANKFHRITAERLQDGLLPRLVKTLNNKPSAIVSMVHSGSDTAYDNLMAVKKIYQPEITHLSSAMRERVQAKLKQPLKPHTLAQYNDEVLEPLRYDIMQRAYDVSSKEPHFDGDLLVGELHRLGAYMDPQKGVQPGEYLDEVFTNPVTKEKYFDKVYELAQALKGAGNAAAGEMLFIKFAQAGVAVQATQARFAPGAAVRITSTFLTPVVLAKIFTNPRYVSEFAEAVRAGPKSTAFSRFTATAARLAADAKLNRGKMSRDEQQFYADKPTKPPQLPWTMGLGGFR